MPMTELGGHWISMTSHHSPISISTKFYEANASIGVYDYRQSRYLSIYIQMHTYMFDFNSKLSKGEHSDRDCLAGA